ncbi:serine protease FAM111A-like [Heterodontus francisci]|uniref:serine protease FAM111A-like n=1 Tax=Heterodontus francisci TaxID=7792 RepID=UPI00355B022C
MTAAEMAREFTFAFPDSEGERHTARGEPDQSLLSALRGSSDAFVEEERKNEGKEVQLVEREHLRGALNPGMPCRCLTENAHLEVSFSADGSLASREDSPRGRECVAFTVGPAAGKRWILKGPGPPEAGMDLCVYAMEGETAGEALSKDGRFLPQVANEGWKLVQRQTLKDVPLAQPVKQLHGGAFELEFQEPGGPSPDTCSGGSPTLRELAQELGEYLQGLLQGRAPWEAARKEFEELTGGAVPNRVPSNVAKLPLGMNEAVGTLRWSRPGNVGSASCFHLARGYVLTCYHAVKMMVGDGLPESDWGQAIREVASVSFTYKTATETQWKVMDGRLRAFSPELDYAVLGLEIPAGRAAELRPGLATWSTKPISRGVVYTVGRNFADSLMLVPLSRETEDMSSRQSFQAFSAHTFGQHPRPERVAYDTEFLHDSTSSGSPVFSYYGGLVGMHAGGYRYEDHVVEFGPTIQAVASHINLSDRSFYQLLFGANPPRKGCSVM